MISDAEKEKQKIDIIENPLTPPEIVDDLIESGGGTDTDTSGGICPDGSYFCKTINECLPSDTPCPK